MPISAFLSPIEMVFSVLFECFGEFALPAIELFVLKDGIKAPAFSKPVLIVIAQVSTIFIDDQNIEGGTSEMGSVVSHNRKPGCGHMDGSDSTIVLSRGIHSTA